MKSQRPRVSIGMPVYNGEYYLHEALDSILAQTYPHFELVISDNASTDATQGICREYAARDARIRYYRNEQNLGLAPNFNRVLELSTGDYFRWAAHDDIIAPEYLAKCVERLDRDPLVVLCEPKTKLIDAAGKVIGSLPVDPETLGSPHRHVRFGHLLLTDRSTSGDYSALIRSSVLRMTIPYQSYPGGEHALRAELGLRGRFAVIPEYLFFIRRHSGQSYRRHPAMHAFAEWVDARNAGKVFYPHWSRLADYVRCVRRIPMSGRERIQCYLKVMRWVLANFNWMRLVLDPVWVMVPGLWGPYYKLKHWFLRVFAKKDSWQGERCSEK